MERKNARTPGRSALVHSCAIREVCWLIKGERQNSEAWQPLYAAGPTNAYTGTGTDSTISRSAASVVSDFLCNEACRALATTRCANTDTASCLKSSGTQ